MDLTSVTSAEQLLRCGHPHFGRVQKLGPIRFTLGLISGTSRKVTALDDCTGGKPKSVALHLDPRNFMVTIAKSFILMTLKDGSARNPVIQKQWKRVDQFKGEGITRFYGTVNTYMDSDGLKWEHRFDRETDEDELVGFGNDGKELLVITLEMFR